MKTRPFGVSILFVSLALMSSASSVLAQPGRVANPVAAQQQAENVELVSQIGSDVIKVALQEGYAYTISHDDLYIYDISDPAHPSEVTSHDVGRVANSVAVQGEYAYIGAEWSGKLFVVDVSDPEHPGTMGSCGVMGYHALDVAVDGNYAYVTGDPVANVGWLTIVDISNPANPFEAADDRIASDVDGVAVEGDHCFVAADSGVYIYNVSDPTDPSVPRRFGLPYGIDGRGVDGQGSYAYVAAGNGGLYIINRYARQIGQYNTPGYARGVAVAGNYAYVADGSSGLRVIEVADRYNPTEVGFYDTDGYAYDVAVDGDYIYVADGDEGLVILRFEVVQEEVQAEFFLPLLLRNYPQL